MTTPLSQKEQTTRKLALTSLLFLPLYGIPAAFISKSQTELASALFITFIILNLILALVAWITRDRSPAIAAIVVPFATIPLTVLAWMFRAVESMRLY